MANFTITSDSTVSQTLNSNETGTIAPNGTLITGGTAVQMLGVNNTLAIAGFLYASNAPLFGAIYAESTGLAEILISSSGQVLSADSAISANANRLEVYNQGEISATSSGLNIGTLSENSSFHLMNTGNISGGFAAAYTSSGNNNYSFTNFGTMIGGQHGIYHISGGILLDNGGVIAGSNYSVYSSNGHDEISNGGTLDGTVSLNSGNDKLVNDGGIIQGDVFMGNNDDLFDSRHGTVTGEIYGGLGMDTLRGSAAADTVYGGDHGDVIRGEGGADTLDGGNGQDYLYGGSGDDSLYGGGDGDTIYGNAGDDFIDGGGRHDMLVGGKGDDTLVGGGGADIFVFRRVGNGDDQVNDFQNGSDKIDLSDLGIQNFNALNNTFNAISADTDGVIIDLAAAGGSGSVRLLGVAVVDMDGTDFIF